MTIKSLALATAIGALFGAAFTASYLAPTSPASLSHAEQVRTDIFVQPFPSFLKRVTTGQNRARAKELEEAYCLGLARAEALAGMTRNRAAAVAAEKAAAGLAVSSLGGQR